MKVFYYGNGDISIPLVAALIHAALLPCEHLPTSSEIVRRLNEHNAVASFEAGIPYYVGLDPNGSQIYCMDLKKEVQLGFQAIEGISGLEKCNFSFHGCQKRLNFLMQGGKILWKMKNKTLGYQLMGKGIRKDYFQIVKLVKGND